MPQHISAFFLKPPKLFDTQFKTRYLYQKIQQND